MVVNTFPGGNPSPRTAGAVPCSGPPLSSLLSSVLFGSCLQLLPSDWIYLPGLNSSAEHYHFSLGSASHFQHLLSPSQWLLEQGRGPGGVGCGLGRCLGLAGGREAELGVRPELVRHLQGRSCRACPGACRTSSSAFVSPGCSLPCLLPGLRLSRGCSVSLAPLSLFPAPPRQQSVLPWPRDDLWGPSSANAGIALSIKVQAAAVGSFPADTNGCRCLCFEPICLSSEGPHACLCREQTGTGVKRHVGKSLKMEIDLPLVLSSSISPGTCSLA